VQELLETLEVRKHFQYGLLRLLWYCGCSLGTGPCASRMSVPSFEESTGQPSVNHGSGVPILQWWILRR
jgi:hypothetical protein